MWRHKHLWQARPTMTPTNLRQSDTKNTCDKHVQQWFQQISDNLTPQTPVTSMSNNDSNKSQTIWHQKHLWEACPTMIPTNLKQSDTTNTCDKHVQQWFQQISDNLTPQTSVTSMSNNDSNKSQAIWHHKHLWQACPTMIPTNLRQSDTTNTCDKHAQQRLKQISGNLTPQTAVTSTPNNDLNKSQAIWHHTHLWQARPTMTSTNLRQSDTTNTCDKQVHHNCRSQPCFTLAHTPSPTIRSSPAHQSGSFFDSSSVTPGYILTDCTPN